MADKREETPDILGDVLGAEGTEEATEQATETPDDITDEQGRGEDSGSSEQEEETNRSKNPGEVPKRKATYYLHEDTLSKLEEVWFKLRQRADEGEKRSVSKSAIVEAAIEIAIEELESDGESAIIERLLG